MNVSVPNVFNEEQEFSLKEYCPVNDNACLTDMEITFLNNA